MFFYHGLVNIIIQGWNTFTNNTHPFLHCNEASRELPPFTTAPKPGSVQVVRFASHYQLGRLVDVGW
jgi:hypothetical protein